MGRAVRGGRRGGGAGAQGRGGREGGGEGEPRRPAAAPTAGARRPDPRPPRARRLPQPAQGQGLVPKHSRRMTTPCIDAHKFSE